MLEPVPKPVSKPLLASDVGAKLGVTAARIRQLDDELKPELTPGGVRIYREDSIDSFVRERESKKESGR